MDYSVLVMLVHGHGVEVERGRWEERLRVLFARLDPGVRAGRDFVAPITPGPVVMSEFGMQNGSFDTAPVCRTDALQSMQEHSLERGTFFIPWPKPDPTFQPPDSFATPTNPAPTTPAQGFPPVHNTRSYNPRSAPVYHTPTRGLPSMNEQTQQHRSFFKARPKVLEPSAQGSVAQESITQEPITHEQGPVGWKDALMNGMW